MASAMFEVQYNDEMEAEIQGLEAKNRAVAAGHTGKWPYKQIVV